MKKFILGSFMLFFTACVFAQFPQEGFEAPWTPDGPVNWSVHQNAVSTAKKWRQNNSLNPFEPAYEGSSCAFLDRQDAVNGEETPKDWLVTPAFVMPPNGQLKFQSRLSMNGNQGGIYRILITTNVNGDLSNLNIYQEVTQWNEPGLNPDQMNYTEKLVSLPNLAGQNVRIAFYMEGEQADRWMVDNVEVVEQCFAPTVLGVTNVTQNSVTLTWNGSSTGQYAVEWMPFNEPFTSVPDIIVTGTSTSIGPLDPTTTYKFYVKSICGEDNESPWAGAFAFNTVPANDECTAAIPLAINPTNVCEASTSGTINAATPSLAPNACLGTADDDVWFSFVAANTTHLISLENITGSTNDLNHAVYSGNCGSLNQLVCSNPNYSTATGLTIGQTYYIRVYTATATSGQTTNFNICVGTPPGPPVNDECANAVTVPVNSNLMCTDQVTGTVFSATASPQANSCMGNTDDDDVWFKFVAASTSQVINFNNVTGTTTGLASAIYNGNCGALVQQGCNTTLNYIVGGLTVGETYYLRVYTTSTTPQNTVFKLCITTPPPPPVNDECVNATPVTVNPTLDCVAFTQGTIAWSTGSLPAITPCGGTADDDVWFSFVATSTTHTINIDNILGQVVVDLNHIVYSGTCNSLTNVLCSNPDESFVTGLTIGNTYYIRVYSNSVVPFQTTVFNVCVSTPPAPPVNDECVNSIVLTPNTDLACTNQVQGTTEWATPSPQTAACPGTEDDDVWYEFVATSTSHTIHFDFISGTTNLIGHTVYSGTNCSALTQVECSEGNDNVLTGLTVGNTYKIRVFSSPASQSVVFNICIGTPPAPPVNDNCSDATPVTVNPDLLCGTVTAGVINYATPSPETTNCSGDEDDDVWFQFVATSTVHAISLLNIVGQTGLYHSVYAGNVCGSLTQLYCNGGTQSVATNLTIGQTYKVRVYTSTSLPLQISSFNVCIGTPPPPPSNDECANAMIVPVNTGENCVQTVPGTINWATASVQNGATCAGTEDDDVWFEFVATSTKQRIELLNATGAQLYFTVYASNICTASPAPLLCSTATSNFVSGLTIGSTYKIRVYSLSNISGQLATFDVCITTPPPPPANDNCENATVVPVNPGMECLQTMPGTIYSATASPQSQTVCSGTEDDDVWFEFEATATSHRIQLINIVNGTTMLNYAVYEGDNCGTIALLYCSTTSSSIADGLTIGTTYKVRVYSSTATANQTSDFEICITTAPPTPVNDECVNAIVVPVNTGAECTQSVTGTVYSATASAQPNNCTGSPDDDVWFEFTATNDVHFIDIRVIGGSEVLFHTVYSGGCNSLDLVECNAGPSNRLVEGLVPGETYKIRVYSQLIDPQAATFEICVGVPVESIEVDETAFTTEELVKNVLFSSPCAVVTNVTSRTGTNWGQPNGISYFTAQPNDFAWQDGVILATTSVLEATYPAGPGGTQTNQWLGDNDLEEVLEANGFTDATFNASVLEFDFLAYTNEFTFDFLFASDEYGVFQCGFADAFAFLLYDLDNPGADPINLAVIPETNTPVSVTTIRDEQWNNGCDSQNIEYFAQYHEENQYANPIGFNGWTVPFTAHADVVPGHNYHIKFVVADYRDAVVNCAVFLGGGTFDVGNIDLGEDLTVENGSALCNSEEVEIATNLVGTENFDFEWLRAENETEDAVLIPDANQPTLIVTEAGIYTVRATYTGTDCALEGSVMVEIYDDIEMGEPANISMCNATGFASFDMASNINAILNGIDTEDPEPAYDLDDFTVTFHLTEADALSGNNPIGPVYTNEAQWEQTVYASVIYNPWGCRKALPFALQVKNETPQFDMPEDFNICEGATDAAITIVPGANFNPDSELITISWTHDGEPLTETGLTVPVTGPGVYEVTVDNWGCENIQSVTVIETPLPVISQPEDITSCGVYILPALENDGNRYFDMEGGPNGDGIELFEGDEITETSTIWIYAESGSLPTNCTTESSFVITIGETPVFDLEGPYEVCDPTDVIIEVQNASFDIVTANYAWTLDGTSISGNDPFIAAIGFGTYEVTVTTAEGCTYAQSTAVSLNTNPIAMELTQGCDNGIYMINVAPVDNSYDPDIAVISWTGPNGFNSSEASVAIEDKGVYKATITTVDGCIGEQSITVENTGCLIPRGISPNNDGMNDEFDLSGFGVTKLSIFNRYGREVYSKKNYTNEWHGQTNEGGDLPTGTYFYSIELSDGISKTGWVYINREIN